MPTIELDEAQVEELRDTVQERIEALEDVLEDADPVEAIGLQHLRESLKDILTLLENA
jgi:hypothetical protein